MLKRYAAPEMLIVILKKPGEIWIRSVSRVFWCIRIPVFAEEATIWQQPKLTVGRIKTKTYKGLNKRKDLEDGKD